MNYTIFSIWKCRFHLKNQQTNWALTSRDASFTSSTDLLLLLSRKLLSNGSLVPAFPLSTPEPFDCSSLAVEQSPVGCQETAAAATIRLLWRRGSSEMTKKMTNLYNKNLLLLLAADIVFSFLMVYHLTTWTITRCSALLDLSLIICW